MKTNKSYTKRLKATQSGKLVSRKPGQNHFNAKETGSSRLNRRRTGEFILSNKARNRFIRK